MGLWGLELPLNRFIGLLGPCLFVSLPAPWAHSSSLPEKCSYIADAQRLECTLGAPELTLDNDSSESQSSALLKDQANLQGGCLETSNYLKHTLNIQGSIREKQKIVLNRIIELIDYNAFLLRSSDPHLGEAPATIIGFSTNREFQMQFEMIIQKEKLKLQNLEDQFRAANINISPPGQNYPLTIMDHNIKLPIDFLAGANGFEEQMLLHQNSSSELKNATLQQNSNRIGQCQHSYQSLIELSKNLENDLRKLNALFLNAGTLPLLQKAKESQEFLGDQIARLSVVNEKKDFFESKPEIRSQERPQEKTSHSSSIVNFNIPESTKIEVAVDAVTERDLFLRIHQKIQARMIYWPLITKNKEQFEKNEGVLKTFGALPQPKLKN